MKRKGGEETERKGTVVGEKSRKGEKEKEK